MTRAIHCFVFAKKLSSALGLGRGVFLHAFWHSVHNVEFIVQNAEKLFENVFLMLRKY